MLGTDGRLYDSDFDFDGDGKLNAYEYSVMDDVVFGHEDTETSEVDELEDEVANANQAKIRELIQGKNIVYIYHNQVDARGDKAASENEVFNACAEAIDEIHRLIKRLTGYVSAPKFFITADHGFLYKRDKLQEFDKVSYPKEKCLYTNKRFIITEEPLNEQGVMARTMAYMNKLYVDTPIGADIISIWMRYWNTLI